MLKVFDKEKEVCVVLNEDESAKIMSNKKESNNIMIKNKKGVLIVENQKFKKNRNILGILLLVLFTFSLVGCNKSDKSNNNLENELLKNDYEKLDFKCDVLNRNIKDYNNSYALTNDGDLYYLSFDKKFSDESNCKKVNGDIKITKIINSNIVMSGNDYYTLNLDYEDLSIDIQKYIKPDKEEEYFDENTRSISIYEYVINQYSSDGNIVYKHNRVNEYIIYSDKELTHITISKGLKSVTSQNEYVYDEMIQKTWKIPDEIISEEIKDVISYQINAERYGIIIETERGYYFEDIINKEKCENYVDVECEYGFVKNEILSKYKSDVQTIIKGNIFDTTGNVYVKEK